MSPLPTRLRGMADSGGSSAQVMFGRKSTMPGPPSPIHNVRAGDTVRRSSVRSSAPLATGGGGPSRARRKEAVYKSSGNDGPARKRGINVGSGIGYTHGEVT